MKKPPASSTPLPGLTTAASPWTWQVVLAYVNLTKPRIIVLLLFTTVGAMVMAAEGMPPIGTLLLTLLGGALGAGAANAMNCYFDRDIDAVMRRTALRAVPSGAVSPDHALIFSIGLMVASFLVLALWINLLSALLTLAAFAFYVVIYTRWLKRSSVHNIVIGGAAGAVPPLVGWAAVTGEVGALALFLFMVIFLWTPPHFWALSLIVKDDYARAGIPMLPVVRGDRETHWQILGYAAALGVLTLAAPALGLLGALYLAGALILGIGFLACSLALIRRPTEAAAYRVFKYSLAYLPLLIIAMVLDRQLPL
jgi:protoheme IX farnesyltransferase